jgi:tetratricopeptide (TPR) repeat protein
VSERFKKLEITPRQEEKTSEALRGGTPVRGAADHFRGAVAAMQLGRCEEALRLYTRALSQERSMIPAWVGQVQMLVELDELTEARLWSDKALELFRGNGDLLAGKARACARMGDRRAAMACSDASLQSPGTSPARWQARGEVLLEQGSPRARDCFDKSLTEPQADWFDRVVIARIHLFHDRALVALEFARLAIGLQPAHPYAWCVAGRCHEALGWFEQARISYERCLELGPRLDEAAAALSALRGRTPGQRLRGWLRGWLRR